MTNKAKELVVKCGVTYEATEHQWWEKSENGKSWNLWQHVPGEQLRYISRLDARRVVWVLPFEEEG